MEIRKFDFISAFKTCYSKKKINWNSIFFPLEFVKDWAVVICLSCNIFMFYKYFLSAMFVFYRWD